MDAFGDDFKLAPKGKRKAYEVEYESLSQEAVEKLIKDDVEHICGIFGVDVSGDKHLLRSGSNWHTIGWDCEPTAAVYVVE